MKNTSQLILALDLDSLEDARSFVNRLYPKIKIFKVGSHLFTAYGPEIIDVIKKKGGEVFLDLKYFDIPNTVAKAVAAACRLGVSMLTLHIAGGKKMVEAAVRAAQLQARELDKRRPLLIGVTVLTSQNARPKEVLELAKAGLSYGLDGIVCSANEAAFLRQKIKKKFLIITPGIRTNDSSKNDQKRTATPLEAQQAGSDYLVIGRPILDSENPVLRTEEILGELYGGRN